MTGAIRTQVRLSSANIKTPQGEVNERICPHCDSGREETTEHIFWDCTFCADLRALTKVHLDQIMLQSPARAGIPSDWIEWPAPLRAFGIIGLDAEVVLAMKELPTQRVKGPSLLIPIDYLQLLSWRSHNISRPRRTGKCPRFIGDVPAFLGEESSNFWRIRTRQHRWLLPQPTVPLAEALRSRSLLGSRPCAKRKEQPKWTSSHKPPGRAASDRNRY